MTQEDTPQYKRLYVPNAEETLELAKQMDQAAQESRRTLQDPEAVSRIEEMVRSVTVGGKSPSP